MSTQTEPQAPPAMTPERAAAILEERFELADPQRGSMASVELASEAMEGAVGGRHFPAQGHLRGADRAARVWYAKLGLLCGRAPFGPFVAATAAYAADVALCGVGVLYPDKGQRSAARGRCRAYGRRLFMGLRQDRPELKPAEGIAVLAWALLFAVVGQWGGGSYGSGPLNGDWAEPLDAPGE